jgi:uncharacterized protein YwgA
MQPADWLVLLLDQAPNGLEPVRVQKALFLLAKEGGLPREERYAFVPYNYGPMSRAIYRDVERLEEEGIVVRSPVPGSGRSAVRLTPRGAERARWLDRVAAHAHPTSREALRRIRADVERRSFADLLRTIYARYPEYAARSVFRRP